MGEKTRSASVARALHGAFCRGASGRELMDLAARKILGWGRPFAAVSIHGAEGDRPRTVSRPGLSAPGAGVAERADRATAEGADLTVLIRRNEVVLATIAAQHTAGSEFSDRDVRELTEVADALAALL